MELILDSAQVDSTRKVTTILIIKGKKSDKKVVLLTSHIVQLLSAGKIVTMIQQEWEIL